MKNLKVVLDLDYIGIDVSYDLEVCDDELDNLPDDPDDREMELCDRFSDDVWDVIKCNLCWHIEEEDE